MKKIVALIVACMFMSGCAPVLIGAIAYSSSKDKKAKQEFMAGFNDNNTKRELSGLPPLDFCTEAIRFDRNWAYRQVECKALKPSVTRKRTK